MMKQIVGMFVILVVLGAGCASGSVAETPTPPEQPAPELEGYEGWNEIQSGGIASFRIPAHCNADPAAGSLYIVCPENEGDTPTPEMVISSDGMVVQVRRWEGLASPYWDRVVASMRILTPLDREIQILIEE